MIKANNGDNVQRVNLSEKETNMRHEIDSLKEQRIASLSEQVVTQIVCVATSITASLFLFLIYFLSRSLAGGYY